MSKVLQLTEAKALQAYKDGDKGQKQLLENLYGKEVFNRKITDRVKSFEDACAVLGIDPTTAIPDLSALSDKHRASTIAGIKLGLIAEALNEGWYPDWNNSNEYKYYPYFDMSNGFSFVCYGFGCTSSGVGSRLCFQSRELARYAGTTFTDLYKDYFVIA